MVSISIARRVCAISRLWELQYALAKPGSACFPSFVRAPRNSGDTFHLPRLPAPRYLGE